MNIQHRYKLMGGGLAVYDKLLKSQMCLLWNPFYIIFITINIPLQQCCIINWSFFIDTDNNWDLTLDISPFICILFYCKQNPYFTDKNTYKIIFSECFDRFINATYYGIVYWYFELICLFTPVVFISMTCDSDLSSTEFED